MTEARKGDAAPPTPAMGLRVILVDEEGAEERFAVDAERALLGSAPHCEIRLSSTDASPEHVELWVSERRVEVQVRPGCVPLTVSGKQVLRGTMEPSESWTIGRITVRVETFALERRAPRRVWPMLALLPVMAAVAWGVSSTKRPRSALSYPPAPPLFARETSACSLRDAQMAEALANGKLLLARAERERSPFAPAAAVRSVALFGEAAACFAVAGREQRVQEATSAGDELRRHWEEEYQVRRVHLEHGYETDDPESVSRELAVLLPLCAHLGGPYVEWLFALGRQVDQKLAQRRAAEARLAR